MEHRIRSYTLVLALVAVVLVGSSATAISPEAGVVALVDASAVEVAGTSTVQGALGSIVHEPNVDGLTVSVSLDVVKGIARTAVLRSVSAGGAVAQENARDTETTEVKGSLVGGTGRASYYVGVFPTGNGASVTIQGADAVVTPPTSAEVLGHQFVPTQLAIPKHTTTGETHVGMGSGPLAINVNGSFVLMLWEMDLSAEATGNTLRTGSQHEAADPSLPPGSATAVSQRTDRQLYLFVEDGSLDIITFSPEALDLHVAETSIGVDGSLTFLGAKAQIADGSQLRTVDAQSMVLEGDLKVASTGPSSDKIPLRVTGQARSISTDGQALAWAAPIEAAGNSSFSWWPLLMFGFVATPGLVAGGVYGHRWTQTARMTRLENLMETGQWDAVAKKAPALSGSKHFGLDASIMQVDALIRLGKLDQALEVATRLRAPNEASGAVIDFTLAYLYAARGEHEKSVAHAVACIRVGPEFREQLRNFPEFARVRSDPRLRGVLPTEPATTIPPGYA